MDVYKTHGTFSWSELTTTDPAGAAAFHSGLFGWQVGDATPEMGDYRMARIGQDRVAGIMSLPPGSQPMTPHWGVYVTVNDVEKCVDQAKTLGAQVLVPPMDVPAVGRMAVRQFPQGAVFSVLQYSAA